MEITELMQTGKQVVYVDETQFHKQQLKERAWIRRDMTLRKPDGRGSGVNVIGAISEKQGLVHYTILRETNKTDTFANFVSELKYKIKGEAYINMKILPLVLPATAPNDLVLNFDFEELKQIASAIYKSRVIVNGCLGVMIS